MTGSVFRFSEQAAYRAMAAAPRPGRAALCAAILFALVFLTFFSTPVLAAPSTTAVNPQKKNDSRLAANLAGRRYSATRAFGGDVAEKDAVIVAETAARAAAMQNVVRTLVALPEVRISGNAAPVLTKSPNLLALAHATVKTSILLVSKSRKTSSVTVTIVIDEEDGATTLESRAREALVHPDRLALYETAVLREKALLAAFDSLKPTRGQKNAPGHGPAGHMPEDAAGIVREMQALGMFVALLPSRNGLWKNPGTVQTAMDKALALAPKSALCRNAMGDALLQMGRSQEAVEQQSLAIKSSPSFARAYHSRGAAALARGHHSSAIADFSEAVRLAPEIPAHYRARGMAHHLAGETAAMCRDLYQACTLGECEEFQWAVFNNFCAPARYPQK